MFLPSIYVINKCFVTIITIISTTHFALVELLSICKSIYSTHVQQNVFTVDLSNVNTGIVSAATHVQLQNWKVSASKTFIPLYIQWHLM